MKKLLIVCTRFPYPVNGGDKLRVASNINFLKKKFKIDICYIGYEYINIPSKIKNVKNIFKFNLKKKKLCFFIIEFFIF